MPPSTKKASSLEEEVSAQFKLIKMLLLKLGYPSHLVDQAQDSGDLILALEGTTVRKTPRSSIVPVAESEVSALRAERDLLLKAVLAQAEAWKSAKGDDRDDCDNKAHDSHWLAATEYVEMLAREMAGRSG